MTLPRCLYGDADARPVSAEAVKVADRHGWPVLFLHEHGQLPRGRSRFLQKLDNLVQEARRTAPAAR